MASMSGPAIEKYEAVKAGSPPMSANAAGSGVPSRLNVHWIDVPVIGSVMVYGATPAVLLWSWQDRQLLSKIFWMVLPRPDGCGLGQRHAVRARRGGVHHRRADRGRIRLAG